MCLTFMLVTSPHSLSQLFIIWRKKHFLFVSHFPHDKLIVFRVNAKLLCDAHWKVFLYFWQSVNLMFLLFNNNNSKIFHFVDTIFLMLFTTWFSHFLCIILFIYNCLSNLWFALNIHFLGRNFPIIFPQTKHSF